jgi:MoaA/NifB/PqqE/SkfB family radical SAM enzyme
MRDSYTFGCVLIHDIRCSNSCVFCRAGEKDLPDDLTREAERKLHRDTVGVLRRGIRNLDVSGNEPLRYSKIAAYLAWIRPRFAKITLLDPGNRLHDPGFARSIVETGVDTFVVPLYGSTAGVHDSCVGNPGAFEQVSRGLANLVELRKASQRIELTTIILSQNAAHVLELARYVRDELRLPDLVVNSPMATAEEVGRFFHEFNVDYSGIRHVVLELAALTGLELRFRYVPPCLFSAGELEMLAGRGGIELLNAHFDYRLAGGEENRARLEYSSRYRLQVPHEGCHGCALYRGSACGGLLRLHHEANEGFAYNPVSEDLAQAIHPILRELRVNE